MQNSELRFLFEQYGQQRLFKCMCVYVCIYMYTNTHIHIYIYISHEFTCYRLERQPEESSICTTHLSIKRIKNQWLCWQIKKRHPLVLRILFFSSVTESASCPIWPSICILRRWSSNAFLNNKEFLSMNWIVPVLISLYPEINNDVMTVEDIIYSECFVWKWIRYYFPSPFQNF